MTDHGHGPSGRRLAVVTGGTGHLGTNLVHELVDRGWAVRVLGAEPVGEPRPDIDRLAVDRRQVHLSETCGLADAFAGAHTVFHLAGVVSISERDRDIMSAVNVDGTASVLSACRLAGVPRLVHYSSVVALSPDPRGVLDEDRPLVSDPTAPSYDRTKAASERLVLDAVEQGVDAVIVSPTGVIGPRDNQPSAMGRFLLQLWSGRMPALPTGGFDWVDARDVAIGAIAAAERGQTGRRYLLGGTWASNVELAHLAAARAGTSAPRLRVPLALARMAAPLADAWSTRAGRPPQLTPASVRTLRLYPEVDGSRARRELGYSPRPLSETLRDVHSWFVQAGALPPPDHWVASAA